METKICNKCGMEKELKEFRQYKKKTKDSVKILYRSECKECELKYKREHYRVISQNEEFKIKNREKAKRYRDNNIEKVREREKEYRESHREQAREYYKQNKDYFAKYKKTNEKYIKQQKEYRTNNKEKIRKNNKEYKKRYKIEHREEYLEKRKIRDKRYRESHKKERKIYIDNHRERINETKRNYDKMRRKTDPLYKFEKQIRGMISGSFSRKKIKKNSRTYEIIGCDFETFYKHLLKTFKDNYGVEWDGKEDVHIDHIIPLAEATTEQEIIKLCHYTNLQLLLAKDNLDKKDKTNWKLEK